MSWAECGLTRTRNVCDLDSTSKVAGGENKSAGLAQSCATTLGFLCLTEQAADFIYAFLDARFYPAFCHFICEMRVTVTSPEAITVFMLGISTLQMLPPYIQHLSLIILKVM